MGMLIKFELRKILGNRAGMVSCALVLALLVAMTMLNALTMGAWDYDTGSYVEGMQALQELRTHADRHAGLLTDERVAADAAVHDQATKLAEEAQDFFGLSDQQIIERYGLVFWQQTAAVLNDVYYNEIAWTLDSATPRASSLQEGAQARIEGALSQGFWSYFPYTEAEKAYWRSLEDDISWPLAYGYEHGWHDILRWKGFSGLAVVAVCIALSGVFAGEYQDRTAAVVLPTRRGKRALPLAKVLASLIFTTAYWLLLVVIIISTRLILYGADGWGLSLQVSQGLDVPYPLTVGQAVMRSYVLGYVVALGAAAFTLFVSSKLRSTMPAAVVPMSVVFLGILALFATPLAKVAMLTPFTGLSYTYDEMVSYAVGPLVAGLPTVLALLYGLMLVVLAPLAMRAFRRHQVM